MSREKIFHLRALGATVLLTRSDVNKGHPAYYQDYARRLADETPGAFYIDQFNNDANPLAHATSTAPELYQQLEGDIDAIIVGVGSGGTLGGLQAWFAEHSPKTEFILADPAGSILADQVDTGRYGETGSWLVEGIGEDLSRRWPGWRGTYRVSRQRPRSIPDCAPAAAGRRRAGRFFHRHPAQRRAALLPGAKPSETGSNLRLRQRQ